LSIYPVLLTTGVIAEALVLALLSWRREYRRLPMFYIYIVWAVVSDCSMPVLHWRFPDAYVAIFLVETSLDSLLQYGVLVELAWSVLRPFHVLPPRRVLPATALGVLAAGRAGVAVFGNAGDGAAGLGHCVDCASAGDVCDSARRVLSGAGHCEPLAGHRVAQPRTADSYRAGSLFPGKPGGDACAPVPVGRDAELSQSGFCDRRELFRLAVVLGGEFCAEGAAASSAARTRTEHTVGAGRDGAWTARDAGDAARREGR
jgi:hypothetical protein